MNRKVTAALALVALALVGLLLLVETPDSGTRLMNVTPYPTTLPAVVAVEDGSVQRVTLWRAEDDATVELARDAEGIWQVVAPVTGAADPWAMGSVLGAFTNLQPMRRLEPGEIDPAVVGLAPPQALVEATLVDGAAVRIWLGEQNPQGTALYAQVEGDEAVYLISRGAFMQALEMFDTPPLEPTPLPTETPTAAP